MYRGACEDNYVAVGACEDNYVAGGACEDNYVVGGACEDNYVAGERVRKAMCRGMCEETVYRGA